MEQHSSAAGAHDRKWWYGVLEGDGNCHLSKIINYFLIILIFFNILAVILETVPAIYDQYFLLFDVFDYFSVAVFSIEYCFRAWVCVENPKYAKTKWGRLRYLLTPMAIIDLLSILPFYLGALVGVDLRFLRALRLLRVFKLTRYSSAMSNLLTVLRDEASTLAAGFFILFILLILASSGAYLVEHEAQPEAFGTVPDAMWWALVTLTTVGYGDVTPITVTGRIFGGIITIIGVGMAALPAGILATGLADQVRHRRDELKFKFYTALQDGHIDEKDEKKLEALRKKLGLSKMMAEQVRQEVVKERAEPALVMCPYCEKSFSR